MGNDTLSFELYEFEDDEINGMFVPPETEKWQGDFPNKRTAVPRIKEFDDTIYSGVKISKKVTNYKDSQQGIILGKYGPVF